MNTKIYEYISFLQGSGILPKGEFTCDYWEQQASYICRVSLKEGYYIKKYKRRFSSSDEDNANLVELFENECNALELIGNYYDGYEDISIPVLVHTDIKELTIVTKKIQGISLEYLCNQYTRRIGAQNNKAPEACYNVGRFLRILHTKSSKPFESSHLSALIKYIQQRLPATGISKKKQEVINEYLIRMQEKVLEKINHYSLCYVHHDLNPTNVLVDVENIGVVDFADSKYDTKFQDIIYFQLMLYGQLRSTIKYDMNKKIELLNQFRRGYSEICSEYCNDSMYSLYMLKNYVLFIATIHLQIWDFTNLKKSPFGILRLIQKFYDYSYYKSKLLRIIP